MEHSNTTVEPAAPAESGHNGNLLAPDVVMVILTWVTFGILFAILKKYAWKPILEGLQKREDYIRKTLDEADLVKSQLAGAEATKAKILDEAKGEASRIIQESRQTAAAVASDIEAQAKRHANDIVSSAKSQIEGERQRVSAVLKREAVDTAIKLAEKVLEENLDNAKNRALIEKAVTKDMNS